MYWHTNDHAALQLEIVIALLDYSAVILAKYTLSDVDLFQTVSAARAWLELTVNWPAGLIQLYVNLCVSK